MTVMNSTTGVTSDEIATTCGGPLLPISLGPGGMTGFDARSFCLPPCCVPCPPQGTLSPLLITDTFFPQYVSFFKVLDVVNLVSLLLVLLYCLLWIGVLYRCPKFRIRSRYVVGTAVALVFWHIPGLITLVAKPVNVLCGNEITRATNKNRICLAQGFLVIFSTHAVVLWGALRIAYVYLQMRKSCILYLQHDVIINNLIAWGVPAIFATIALATGQIEYVTSHHCGPSMSRGQALIWVPLLVYVSIASVLQLWTLVEIEEATPTRDTLTTGHREESSTRRTTYENVPTIPAHVGARSEITEMSNFGAQSDIDTESPFGGGQSVVTEATNITFTSQSPIVRSSHGRYNIYEYETSAGRRSRASRRTTSSLGTSFIRPVGNFSRSIKDRGRFVWELFKMNYRMLISLTLTLFVAIFISVNSLLFQNSIYSLPDPTGAFIKWMECVQTPGQSAETCSSVANDLFPLSFWRNVTADAARASFGTIFFIVEITKGDFWRAIKERHPFALTISRGPRPLPSRYFVSKLQDGFSSDKLTPSLPSRICKSFLRRHEESRPSSIAQSCRTTDSPLQLPELTFHDNRDLRLMHHNTFPGTYPKRNVYLHTPQRELESPPPSGSSKYRRMSLPSLTSQNPMMNSALHVPVSIESSTFPSTRTSLRSLAAASVVLENQIAEGKCGEN